METLILTLHIIVCVLLVIFVLLQSGKEGMGVIFGGGNATMFGNTGAGSILVKLTTMLAIIFVITSLSYTYVTSSHPEGESTILNVKIEDAAPAPSQPPANEQTGGAGPAGAPPEAPSDGSGKTPATP